MIMRFLTARGRGLALLFLCLPAPSFGDSWQELIDQAELFAEEGKYQEATSTAQDALANEDKRLGPDAPERVRLLSRLSRIYERTGDVQRVAEMGKRLSAIKSKDYDVWLSLGMLLRFQERFPSAEEALKNALKFKPDDFGAENELAMLYEDMGRDEEAAALVQKELKRDPQNRDLSILLAKIDVRLGLYVQSKEAFAQARKFGGHASDLYIEEGYFDQDVGKPAEAEEDFENAVSVDTSSPFGYHHLGVYLGAHGQYPEAEKNLRKALALLESDPNTKTDDLLHTVDYLGTFIMMQGRTAEAEAVFRKCLSQKASPSPVYLWCLSALGKAYASQGLYSQTEFLYKQGAAACEKGPACACRGSSLIKLGELYLHQGRRPEAQAMADQAGVLCGGFQENTIRVLRVFLDLGGFYVRLGDVSKGEALFGRILSTSRLMPFDAFMASAQEAMADLDMTRRRFAEAEAYYRQAIGIMDHNGYRKEEADLLDKLADVCDKELKVQDAAAARGRAKALRGAP